MNCCYGNTFSYDNYNVLLWELDCYLPLEHTSSDSSSCFVNLECIQQEVKSQTHGASAKITQKLNN